MNWQNWLLVVLLPAFMWMLSAHLSQSWSTLRDKKIVLLIAHPDDEAMFFSPSVQALSRPSLGNHLKILCLSTGDADGLGQTRRKELEASGLLLGLRGKDDVMVLDVPEFRDSMTTTWAEGDVVNLLQTLFAKGKTERRGGKTDDAPLTTSIDVIITFDKDGISGHPNHISLYHGAKAWVKGLTKGRTGWKDPVAMYTLPSRGVVRKYGWIFDVPVTVLGSLLSPKAAGEYPTPLISVSGMAEYATGRKAMTDAHVSQMRWFRWGWIVISRYMLVNDLRREKLS